MIMVKYKRWTHPEGDGYVFYRFTFIAKDGEKMLRLERLNPEDEEHDRPLLFEHMTNVVRYQTGEEPEFVEEAA